MKKYLYLALWVVLGMMLGILAAAKVELWSVFLYGELTLKSVLYGILIMNGAVLGLFVGPYAWKKIYVEGLRGKKYVESVKK